MPQPSLHDNKRTAITSTGLFYALNGYWLRTSQDELVELTLDVVEGRSRGVEVLAKRLSASAIEPPVDS